MFNEHWALKGWKPFRRQMPTSALDAAALPAADQAPITDEPSSDPTAAPTADGSSNDPTNGTENVLNLEEPSPLQNQLGHVDEVVRELEVELEKVRGRDSTPDGTPAESSGWLPKLGSDGATQSDHPPETLQSSKRAAEDRF